MLEMKQQLWSCLRQKWVSGTLEEWVRQDYVLVLVNEYGYALEQMAEEFVVNGAGAGQARADLIVWSSVEDKQQGNRPLFIIECKGTDDEIEPSTFQQGMRYARFVNAPYFVARNLFETRFFEIDHSKMYPEYEEIGRLENTANPDYSNYFAMHKALSRVAYTENPPIPAGFSCDRPRMSDKIYRPTKNELVMLEAVCTLVESQAGWEGRTSALLTALEDVLDAEVLEDWTAKNLGVLLAKVVTYLATRGIQAQNTRARMGNVWSFRQI
nr:type I restriction enzyme HsdR N-terminal domain-containing protein [Bacilli bacterium]